MTSPAFGNEPRFINVLRTQASNKTESRTLGSLPCPFGHPGRIFQGAQQLYDHAKAEHASVVEGLDEAEARVKVRDAAIRSRRSELNIAALSLDAEKERQTSPSSGRKRRAEFDIKACREKGPSNVDHVAIADPDYTGGNYHTIRLDRPRSKPHDSRLYNHKQGVHGIASPQRSATGHSSDPSADLHHSLKQQSSTNATQNIPAASTNSGPANQTSVIEPPKFDHRYPELILQPDSRPISQEQLALEVRSIYVGLTAVEKKCIEVDRAQAIASQDRNQKPTPDHWQVLIALHRTLLHEHHDFFLASQHPSASPALRRLASKYTMPARMWKHGIHSFLELLRRHLPDSLDYMLAFIYLAYQMMALLYETVPAFEDTWIECLGDLGRYRMAIEDEDVRDRETWAGVARSWYSKAADKNPTIGRLYHHLAILARPNPLQQLYYYTTSLNCVEPFPSARESIMTVFKPLISDDQPIYTSGAPIDANFTKLHALLYTRSRKPGYEQVSQDFLDTLDNHIGCVTSKWKDQGVYIAVCNITAWFDYGVDLAILRQLFLLRASQRRSLELQHEKNVTTISTDQPKPNDPKITEDQLASQLKALSTDSAFSKALVLTHDTFALALRRVGDKNVLPHIHIMLSFISTLASIPYVSHLVDCAPWGELVTFLNTLIFKEKQKNNTLDVRTLLSQPLFPRDNDNKERDELPLPEDYLVRGLVWAQEYLPIDWLGGERDEEERHLQLASTSKSRIERVLRLGYRLSNTGRWILYDHDTSIFTIVNA